MNVLSSTLGILLAMLILDGCAEQPAPSIAPERQREYANALYNRELYTQAIVEYDTYLELASLTDEQRANVDYIVGNVYMDQLHDYENAMARYLKVKTLYPQPGLEQEINRRTVECLERLDRSLDAQRELTRATALDPGRVGAAQEGTVIAEVGDRKITSQELDLALERLPQPIRSEYETDREKKLEFLRQYVATELMYDTARRMGYDDDRDIIEQTFQAKKGLMVQKLIEEEIKGSVKIEESEVKLYYDAHRDRYMEEQDGEEIQLNYFEARDQVVRDLSFERQQEAYNKLLARMLSAEEVKIYDDLIE